VHLKLSVTIPLANIHTFNYARKMDMSRPIGLIADSHGRTDLLVRSILMLRDMGAGEIVHLGDICDSLAPLALEDAVSILKEHGVHAIRGNNEYAILVNHQGERRNDLPGSVLSYLEGLPYTLMEKDICFAHSAPFDWPAATSWPITDNHPLIDLGAIMPCRVLFRGHSHTPSIMEIMRPGVKKTHAEAGMTVKLLNDRLYVVTVGAVEKGAFALYLPEESEMHFMQLDLT